MTVKYALKIIIIENLLLYETYIYTLYEWLENGEKNVLIGPENYVTRNN